MNEETRRAILEDLIDATQASLLQEHEFTIRDYSDRSSRLTYEGARHQLVRLVKAGELETGERYDERVSRTVNAFWKREDGSDT